ncbi:LysE/ArgO family amino acid transporter [Cohnella luojiensis]|uniref:Amino acid transporter n=1 Tax=Cohnella luojiensis TaxID=652876 RepID=A0A4Y8LQB1_9BACL|nr:amino acid transporter [Cohnella luojiensis]
MSYFGNKILNVLPIVIAASICDTFLILFAVLGVSVIVLSFVWMKTLLIILGSLFLIYMGYITWRAKTESNTNQEEGSKKTGKLISYTIMISILNPHAILDTIGVIGTSSLKYQGLDKIAFTCACIMISWIWFFSLAILGRFVGSKDKTGKIALYLNKVSAVVMWGVAVYLMISFRKLVTSVVS